MQKKGKKGGFPRQAPSKIVRTPSSLSGSENSPVEDLNQRAMSVSSKPRNRSASTSQKSKKLKTHAQKEELWGKLSEVVDKRRVRFSKFVAATNDAKTANVKSKATKTRRVSFLAKPKKDFSVKGMEELEPPNKMVAIQEVTPGSTPSSPSDPSKLVSPPKKVLEDPTWETGSTIARTQKLLQDKFKMAANKRQAWNLLDFEEIKRNALNAGLSVPDGESGQLARAGSDSFLRGAEIFEILDSINSDKKNRLRKEVEDEMICIHNRVKDALMAVDMLDEEEDLMKGAKSRFPPLNSLEIMKQRREKMYKEKGVMEDIDKYKAICKEREAVIEEVRHWLASKNLMDVLEGEGDIQKTGRYFQEIHSSVMTILHNFTEQSGVVVDLGTSLLNAAGTIIKENQENAKLLKEKQNEKVVVYDERQLLADPVKWENAVKMVLATFEDAMKWTKNNTYKYLFQKGQKQFKEISFAVKKRNQELKEKKKLAEDLKLKLNAARTEVETKTKDVEEMKKTVRTITADIDEKKHLLEKSEEKNKTLQTKVTAAETKVKVVQDEANKKIEEIKKQRPSTPIRARTPTPPPPQIIKVIDSSTLLKLQETEVKLEQAQGQLESKRDEVRQLERFLRIEKERVRQLKIELDEAEKLAAETELTINMPVPTAMQADSAIDAMDKDSGYYKTLLSGMKRDFTAEIDKLKSHLAKERLRNTAAVKKVEIVHREQINSIQKDVVRVLRAIMHFRDHITSILEKENLKDPAAALKDLGSLVPDKLAPDPRELLALLVGNVVEFMHNMESIMANAFLTMRMIMKGAITINAQNQIVARKSETRAQIEEVKRTMKTVDKAKTESLDLAKRLKKAKQKLLKFEELTEKQELHDRKYLALLDRYRAVWKMYNHLQRDMDVLQHDFQDAMEAKVKAREDLLVSQIRMELKNRKVVHEQELRISLEDQKQNLKMLERAYDDNKISKDLYNLASSLLYRSMEIPKKRLRYMMEQYIAFKTVKETKERVGEILGEELLTKNVRRDMELYVKHIDEKFNNSMKKWHEKMHSLEDEKKQLFKTIWRTFNEVFAESGLLLVHPLLNKSTADKTEIYSKMASSVTKETLTKMVRKKKRMKEIMEMPAMIEGRAALKSPLDPESLWNAQFQFCGGDSTTAVSPRIYTPHSMHYDINKERIKAYGTLSGRESREVYPLATIGNYSIINNTRLVC